jgi:hypothetical protein
VEEKNPESVPPKGAEKAPTGKPAPAAAK